MLPLTIRVSRPVVEEETGGEAMRIINTHVSGLDVHKQSVVGWVRVIGADGALVEAKRTFGTMTADLLLLSDWLTEYGVTVVAMESTGEFWKPNFNVQEGNFEVMVVNAQHVSKVPGRKTDQSDAAWLAELLQYG